MPLHQHPGYEVDECGSVRSTPRVVTRSNGRPYTVPAKVLRPRFNGHLQVVLSGVAQYVHRLVLEAHVGPCPSPDHRALHRDDDPYNNHVSNLYWGTMRDNALDRVRNGNDVNARKEFCRRGHRLAGANLAPWVKLPHRCCLTCNRAKTLAHSRGMGHDEAYAAEKYALIALDEEVMPHE